MPTLPPRSPAEGFAANLLWLGRAVVARGGGGFHAGPVIVLILDRIRHIGQRFARLAARVGDGTYRPRRCGPRRKPAAPILRRRDPLPRQFGWLLPLVPEAVGYRSQLEYLLRDPAMAALMAEAPAPMARALRPLCWMLRLTPPPILARPRPEARPAPAAAPRPPPPRPPTPPRSPPPNPSPAPPSSPVLVRACGPPPPD